MFTETATAASQSRTRADQGTQYPLGSMTLASLSPSPAHSSVPLPQRTHRVASHHREQVCRNVWGKSLTMFPIMSFIIPNISMKPPDCSKHMENRVRKAKSVHPLDTWPHIPFLLFPPWLFVSMSSTWNVPLPVSLHTHCCLPPQSLWLL